MVEGVKIVAPWPLILALFLRQISFLKKKHRQKFLMVLFCKFRVWRLLWRFSAKLWRLLIQNF